MNRLSLPINKKGRPATGIKRPKRMTIQFTESEIERLKKVAWNKGLTVADYIMKNVEDDEKEL